MELSERLTDLIYEAIDEANKTSERGEELEKAPDVVLLGPNGRLDSLALVNLAVAVEQKVEANFDAMVSVTDVMFDAAGDEHRNWTVTDMARALANEASATRAGAGP